MELEMASKSMAEAIVDWNQVCLEEKPVVGLSWEPKLPPLSSQTKSGSRNFPETSTSAVYRPSSELIDGLSIPPNDLERFDMPAQIITPELKKIFRYLALRSVVDPKRHYKKGDSKSKALPKYFQARGVRFERLKNRIGPRVDKWKIRGRQSRKGAKRRRH